MKLQPTKRFGRIFTLLYAYIVVLLLCHLIAVYLTLNNPSQAMSSGAAWFDLDREYNIPTVTNSILLWSSAMVFIALALRASKRALRAGWVAFAVLFTYFGFDELLIIHEQLAEPVRRLLSIGSSSPLYHAWVVPAFFVIIGLGCIAWWIRRYYKQLKPCADVIKLVVILASGVICLEILGTFVYGHTAIYRLFMVPLEEIFELSLAAWIFLSALKQYQAKT